MKQKTFMTGKWTDLILTNYTCDPNVLKGVLPNNLEFDLWQGLAVFSLVSFTFSNVRFFGVRIPFHQFFGEMNLRCYVKDKNTRTRGVLFISELAPKHLIAFVANRFYKEPFFFGKVKKIRNDNNLIYSIERNESTAKVVACLDPKVSVKTDFESFLVDRYIAFVRNRKGGSRTYVIRHRPWNVLESRVESVSRDIGNFFPSPFRVLMQAQPVSTFHVDGSYVECYRKN